MADVSNTIYKRDKPADQPRYKVRLNLALSRNMRVIQWGLILGVVGGPIAVFLEGTAILAFLGISATPLAMFCLPLVMIAVGAIAFSGLLRLISWNAGTKEKRHAYNGVCMILDKVISNGAELSDTSKSFTESPHEARFTLESCIPKEKASKRSGVVPSAVEILFKVTVSRFGRGAFVGSILGVAGALTAGWFFSTSLLGLVGLSATAPWVALAYPVVLLLTGALVGCAIGGVAGSLVGKVAAWWTGADKVFPTYRHCFTQIRLKEIATKPNQGTKEKQNISAYQFHWRSSAGDLELCPKLGADVSMPKSAMYDDSVGKRVVSHAANNVQ